MNADRIERMRARLEAALVPEVLEISDDSHLHIGHEGARDGRGHFTVKIASRRFEGASRIERHRMVFDALDDMMQTDIHALKISAQVPVSNSDRRDS